MANIREEQESSRRDAETSAQGEGHVARVRVTDRVMPADRQMFSIDKRSGRQSSDRIGPSHGSLRVEPSGRIPYGGSFTEDALRGDILGGLL